MIVALHRRDPGYPSLVDGCTLRQYCCLVHPGVQRGHVNRRYIFKLAFQVGSRDSMITTRRDRDSAWQRDGCSSPTRQTKVVMPAINSTMVSSGEVGNIPAITMRSWNTQLPVDGPAPAHTAEAEAFERIGCGGQRFREARSFASSAAGGLFILAHTCIGR